MMFDSWQKKAGNPTLGRLTVAASQGEPLKREVFFTTGPTLPVNRSEGAMVSLIKSPSPTIRPVLHRYYSDPAYRDRLGQVWAGIRGFRTIIAWHIWFVSYPSAYHGSRYCD